MRYELRDYQQKTAADAASWLTSASPGQRKLYASPTGTGKSIMELAVQASVSDSESDTWIVTPRIEIVAGMLEKAGHSVAELSEQKLVDLAWDLRITTPIRLRNAMLEGRMPSPPTRLIIDECHHHNADTYGQIDLLAGTCPAVGFTATPYRGSPRSTAAFREAWGDPTWSLTYPEAVAPGTCPCPAARSSHCSTTMSSP
jgi:superfamily II DNA or RNA helicase